MNLKIREFELSLEKYIESADIPAEVKRLILKEIHDRISAEANAAISKELDERELAKRKESEHDE